MPTSTDLTYWFRQGAAADRPATLNVPSNAIGLYWATDTNALSVWAESAWTAIPTGSGAPLSDGDKGDITVASSGTVWTIDNGVVSYAKLQDVSATSRILGRITAGAGDAEELTAANVKTILALAQADISGLTTADSPQFTALNIGHASDTTITRTGAGDIAVEGNAVYRAGGTDVPVTDGGTGASTAAGARTNLGLLRLVAFFFTTAPTTSEVLAIYIAADDFTIAANMSGTQVSVGTNPTATFAIDVQKNGSTIGTISIATTGVVTLTTSGGTSKSIVAGDILKFVAPASVDATIANVAATTKGTL